MPRVKKIEASNIKEEWVSSFNSFGEFLSFNGDKVALSNMSKVEFPKNLLGFEKFLVHINDIENGVSFFIGEKSNKISSDFVVMNVLPSENTYTFTYYFGGANAKKVSYFSKENFKAWEKRLKEGDVVPKESRGVVAKNYVFVSYSIYNLKVDFKKMEQICNATKKDLVQLNFKGSLDVKNPMASFEKVKAAYADLYK